MLMAWPGCPPYRDKSMLVLAVDHVAEFAGQLIGRRTEFHFGHQFTFDLKVLLMLLRAHIDGD